MEEAEGLLLDTRAGKRARLDDTEVPQINGAPQISASAVSTVKTPAMNTKALRSVLKGEALLL